VRGVEIEALVAAGLYDPAAPDASDRLELLRYLEASGASLTEMAEALPDGNLTSLAFDRRLRVGDLSALDLATLTGTPIEEVLEAYRLLGVPVADRGQRTFTKEEARLLEVLAVGRSSLPEGMVEEVLRSIGTALTLIAESAVSAFVGSVEDLLEEGTQRARAEMTTATGELGLELGVLLGPLLRHHLWSAVLRQRAAMRTTVDRRESQVAIGFVDLVGFTATTARMDTAELLEFMQRFHRRTFDVVTAAGGRVVKHIGDEIMFAGADATTGCAIALDLLDAFRDADSLPRGGLAHGTVVARHGDYYGPVVNLAARLADVAVSGEVLADATLVTTTTPDRFAFEPAGRRQLKGFPEPVAAVSVLRRSST
jgi:adenylate cyclase